MAEKTFTNAFHIENNQINFSITNLKDLLGSNKKIINAFITASVINATGAAYNFYINFEEGQKSIIDRVSPSINCTLYINITEELNRYLNCSSENINITFDNGLSLSPNADLKIEYLQAGLSSEHNTCFNFNTHNSEKGKINLFGGSMLFKHPSGIIYNSSYAQKNRIDVTTVSGKLISLPTHCANGWKLDINQHLINYDDTENNTNYIYIDAEGNSHEFGEKYYYLTRGQRVYIDKNDITVDLDGNLKYGNNDIKIDRKTTSGLTLETDYSKFKGGKLLELRLQEQIELEENINIIENELKQFVIINKENGDTICKLKDLFTNNLLTPENFKTFLIKDHNLLLTESESIQYLSLMLQQTESSSAVHNSLKVADSSYLDSVFYSDNYANIKSLAFKQGNYSNRLVDLKRLVTDLKKDLALLIKKSDYGQGELINYQYDSYISYLDKHNYNVLSDKCALNNLIGAGTDLTLPSYNNQNSDTADVLSIPYNHFEGGYCDLQAELECINDDLDLFYREYTKYYKSDNSIDSDKTIKVLSEKKRQKVLEQRLRVFNKQLTNRIDKLQQNIYVFETEVNNYIDTENQKLIDLQLELLIQKSESNIINMNKYYKQYWSAKHNLDIIYRQAPVNFITDNSNVMGFNKDGALVAFFDMYDNYTSILYEDNKPVSIQDSDNHIVNFEYNDDGLIDKIIDETEQKTIFKYNDSNLIEIIKADDSRTIIEYTASGLISSITDTNARGIKIEYDDYGRVIKVIEFSNTFEISDQSHHYAEKTNQRTLALIDYHDSHFSTTITDNAGITTNYIFDILGRPVTVFEGVYFDPEETTRSLAIEYKDNKKSFEISDNLNTINLLSGKTPSENTLANGSDSQRRQTFIISPSELPSGSKEFVFSAWAKADSAHILNSYQNPYSFSSLEGEAKLHADSLKSQRKFSLTAELNYSDGTTDSVSASYDWLNTDWQYIALPVEILTDDTVGAKLPSVFPLVLGRENRTLLNVKLIADYSFNVGEIQFDCFAFREGTWTYREYDSNGNVTFKQDSKNDLTTNYEYDDYNRPIKSVTINSKYKEFVSTFEYNKQGKLVRSTDYNGVVSENFYNDKGNIIKAVKYNENNPTEKIYSESKTDDKGNVTADIDESGEFNSVEYISDEAGTTVIRDGNGNFTSKGYKDGNLVSVSSGSHGESSTNHLSYTLGCLTKTSCGGTDFSYSYDEWQRTKQINIAGQEYLRNVYATDADSETTYANADRVFTKKDKYGNVQQRNVTFADGTYENITNSYDTNSGLLTKSVIDIYSKTPYNIIYGYDAQGRLTREQNKDFVKQHIYNSSGNLERTSYTVNDTALEYSYETDESPSPRAKKIVMPFASQNLSYDGLGRIKEITLGEKLSKNIYYAQYGDHSTNRISSVWYGVNGIRKDNSRYTYDKAGNILTVTENGKLSARYRYDGLNRLIREDNAAFGTFTYSYDENGNILNKTVYGYTLADTLEGGIEHVYAYKQNGWKDQLVIFDDQSCSYDAIGNPTVYRGSAALWRGRRLINYKGVSYSYDVNGIRTDKTVNGVTVKYVCDGTTILAEQRSNSSAAQWLYYIYGADGVAGFTVNGEEYLYRKNIQGDVTHVYKKDGTLVALYSYDAWGNCKVFKPDGSPDEDEGSVGNANPFRYRSYYFDEETGLYYLNSRYYDPEIGRFVNADDISFLDPETINGLNLYAYCGDNPVMKIDLTGHDDSLWKWLIPGLQLLSGFALLFVPGAQGIGISLMIGGSLGLISNAVSPAIAQALGGVSSIANGFGAFSTGISIIGLGIPGFIGGITLILIGGATMAFGVNEIVTAATGTNYIQEWIGLSDSVYNWTYFGLNLVSSIGQIAGNSYHLLKTREVRFGYKGNLKGYRYKNSKGEYLFDFDYPHGNIKKSHYHGIINGELRNRTVGHWGYLRLIWWLITRR